MNKSRHVHGCLSLRRKGCFLNVFTEVASSKMFSKICSDVGLLRRRSRISLLFDSGQRKFSDIASTSRHEGQSAEAKSKKTVRQSAS